MTVWKRVNRLKKNTARATQIRAQIPSGVLGVSGRGDVPVMEIPNKFYQRKLDQIIQIKKPRKAPALPKAYALGTGPGLLGTCLYPQQIPSHKKALGA